jgi:putative ABC transport system permease protein
MKWPSWTRRRIDLDRQLETEIRFHLDERARDLQRAGSSEEESRRRARLEFGSVESAKEACRENQSWNWLETLLHDLRFGGRLLTRNPGFAVAAILSLALGIGATTATFCIIYSQVFKPLPYPEPKKLVALGEVRGQVSAANFYDWQSQSDVFTAMAAYAPWPLNLTGVAEPERLKSALVTPEFFRVLDVSPARGRTFRTDEDQSGKSDVAVVSDSLFTRLFGSGTPLSGQTLTLNGSPTTIVGVMPKSFAFPDREIEIWVPLSMSPQNRQNREGRWLRVIARTKPGKTLATAQDHMNVIGDRLQRAYPVENKNHAPTVVPLQEQETAHLKSRLLILGGAVASLLLVACANITNLLLARATTRTREMTVRAALGAKTSRIIRQLLTENLLISLGGGTLGILLAYWTIAAIRASAIAAFNLREITVGVRVLAVALLLSLLSTMIFGLVPARDLLRTNLSVSLGSGTKTSTDSSAFASRKLIVISELSLAVVLLIGGVLLLQSFLKLSTVDTGFDPHNVLTMRINLPRASNATDEQQIAFFQQALEKLSAVPGVQSVGAISDPPLHGNNMAFKILVEHRLEKSDQEHRAGVRWVAGDYFASMRLALVRGRLLNRQDNDRSEPVAVINRTLASQFWPDTDPIGGRIRTDDETRWFTVVGVVDDVKQIGLDSDEGPAMYLAHTQKIAPWMNWMTVIVSTASDPLPLVPALRSAIWTVDKNQPVSDIISFEKLQADSLTLPKFSSGVFIAFAALATTMALIGIYGILSYFVSQRAKEFGIRMALGAQSADMLKLVMRQAATLIVLGIALGVAGALVLGKSLTGLLFGVRPADPTTFAVVVLIVSCVALVASYIPARRAMSVDPMTSLRCE